MVETGQKNVMQCSHKKIYFKLRISSLNKFAEEHSSLSTAIMIFYHFLHPPTTYNFCEYNSYMSNILKETMVYVLNYP